MVFLKICYHFTSIRFVSMTKYNFLKARDFRLESPGVLFWSYGVILTTFYIFIGF